MIQLEKYDFRNTTEQREAFLRRVKKSSVPGVLIHTCNRVEFYHGQGEVPHWVAKHLFRVVSGLESFFVGETFIQGQVKEQYYKSFETQKIDASLHRLFQWALRTGKRVRTETALSRGAMSHSQAVVEIIRNTIPDYTAKRFAFIGINKLNRTIMNFLKGNTNQSFLLGNRTFDKAQELASEFKGKAFMLDHLKEALEQSDVVISATSAPHAIIKPKHLPGDRLLTIFDLAVPQDVDPVVQFNPLIHYYNIQKIEDQVARNKMVRTEEITKAEEIIDEELKLFLAHHQAFLSRKRKSSSLIELTQ